MEKINFEDLPSTNTPINATNLNQMQTNIETSINGVVESGSNENGSYTKYSDGTIDEWGTYTINSADVSWTALGTALYYSPSYSHALPVQLINTDEINTTCNVVSRSANFDWTCRPSIGNTETETFISFNLVTATNTARNIVIRWFIKGKWK